MAETENTPTPFDRDDLNLLLNAYRNQIESNRTLLEQQARLIDQHNQILNKEQTICDSIGNIIIKVSEVQSKLREKIQDSNVQCIRDHSGLKVRLYIVYAGIGVVVVSLIGLLYNAYDKFEILKDIALKLGV